MLVQKLNLFYEELETDRWLPLDRYPRRLIRRILRGKPRIGGQRRVFLNLCAGLRNLGVKYRVNDYRHIKSNPDELACIVGKPHVLDKIEWKNPILFGAAVFSHPTDDPDLFERLPVRKVLVPGEWMRIMCEPHWGDQVAAWPVGIDTERWCPKTADLRSPISDLHPVDFLFYDKVLWEHDRFENELIQPIRNELKKRGLSFHEIRYGFYEEEDFENLLRQCRAMIFLCEHETQGIAYQQALSCGVPILAWDRGGFWQDPAYYPHKVKFAPVTSVPYWDERCGIKFGNASEFPSRLDEFWGRFQQGAFRPRDYILDNLTLEKCAKEYVSIAERV
jgi:glycosyltransferase involved in cell wall biosynthesis